MGIGRSPPPVLNDNEHEKESNGSPKLKDTQEVQTVQEKERTNEVSEDTKLIIKLITEMKDEIRTSNGQMKKRMERQENRMTTIENEWKEGKERLEEYEDRIKRIEGEMLKNKNEKKTDNSERIEKY